MKTSHLYCKYTPELAIAEEGVISSTKTDRKI